MYMFYGYGETQKNKCKLLKHTALYIFHLDIDAIAKWYVYMNAMPKKLTSVTYRCCDYLHLFLFAHCRIIRGRFKLKPVAAYWLESCSKSNWEYSNALHQPSNIQFFCYNSTNRYKKECDDFISQCRTNFTKIYLFILNYKSYIACHHVRYETESTYLEEEKNHGCANIWMHIDFFLLHSRSAKLYKASNRIEPKVAPSL